VRQPLPEVLVRVRSEAELDGLRRLEDALRDELNVKAVRYLEPTDPFVDYDVKPNLPKVGKRLGKRIPAVRAALAAADGRRSRRRVAEGRPVELDVEGETVAFAPDELLLDARSPEGYAAVEDRGCLAALRTELTPELLREGLMRDAVRLVQDARKQAGLEVADRIELALDADDAEAREALAEHAAALAPRCWRRRARRRRSTARRSGSSRARRGPLCGSRCGARPGADGPRRRPARDGRPWMALGYNPVAGKAVP
jgi:isoleucyl-tRNA synthetase